MTPEEFTNKTGKLVPTLEGNLAFVPHPLRSIRLPALPWDVLRLLSDADAAVAEVAGACSRKLTPFVVMRPFQREEAILSSKIEGTITTAKQLALMEARPDQDSQLDEEDQKDTREVHNYLAALDHGINRLKDLSLSLRLIKELHKKLMTGVRGEEKRPGEFRVHQNAIGKKGQTEKQARFVPPPPNEMMACLDDFEKYLHENKHPPLIKLALMHYQFETIHPFGDGNGRTGRLLIPLLLLAEGRMDNPVLYMSSYLQGHDAEYRDLLLSVSQKATWLEWINFFLQGVVEQCKKTTIRLAFLEKTREEFKNKMQKGPGPLQAIVDDLFGIPVLSADDITRKYKVSHQTAMNWIRRLQGAHILDDQFRSGRENLFLCGRLLGGTGMESESPIAT